MDLAKKSFLKAKHQITFDTEVGRPFYFTSRIMKVIRSRNELIRQETNGAVVIVSRILTLKFQSEILHNVFLLLSVSSHPLLLMEVRDRKNGDSLSGSNQLNRHWSRCC